MTKIITPPGLWLPRQRTIEARDPVGLKMRMAGSFRLTTHNGRGKVFNDSGEFPNLITNAILNAFGTSSPNVENIRVGTSNVAPAETDTALVAEVAAGSSTQATSGGSNVGAERYCWASITRRFSPPGVNYNLQEIGAFTSSTMWSRALILDGGGAPVSFPWGSDEILDATYTFRLYPPIIDWVQPVVIAGVERTVTLRPSEVADWNVRQDNSTGISTGPPDFGGYVAAGNNGAGIAFSGALGPITGSPTGNLGTCSRSLAAYAPDTFLRGATLTFSTSQGNGNIQCVTFAARESNFGIGQLRFQFSMNPVLTKTNVQTLQLYVQTSWGRYTP